MFRKARIGTPDGQESELQYGDLAPRPLQNVMGRASRTVRITNDLGLHMRAAGELVKLAGRYSAEIWLRRPNLESNLKANANSIMGLLSLAACQGAVLELSARGEDAAQAVSAIAELIRTGFFRT